ncbi:hypothetical protein N658DRAFT_432607 [Parathielavia hyrcaniae]|uniref:Uncharacterized protein n=1 Tax=Parathielavia hyrcaniae TaxID=113614 RepID=A0AAN6SYX9_9PEZI|nr:hypothetical protein N658DRAFT_432607 [Parathielavia hyrcaniae]
MELLAIFLFFAALTPVSSSPINPPGEPGRQAEGREPLHPAASAAPGWSLIGHGEPPMPTPAPAPLLDIDIGAQMKPILERREALNLGSPDDASPADTHLHSLPAKGCTTTLEESHQYPCSWDGTARIYPSTTVMLQQVDCNGCDSVHVRKGIYHCPNQVINATQRMAVPSTLWSTTCRPSTGLGLRVGRDVAATGTISDVGSLSTP